MCSLNISSAHLKKDKKMKNKEERQVVHSEETLRQKKQDKLQHHVDQHEGKLLNNLQRLHTLKHVNEVTNYINKVTKNVNKATKHVNKVTKKSTR